MGGALCDESSRFSNRPECIKCVENKLWKYKITPGSYDDISDLIDIALYCKPSL